MSQKKWIQKAIKRPGAFTRKARALGLTPDQYRRKVLANPNRYSTTTVRQARLMTTLKKLRK